MLSRPRHGRWTAPRLFVSSSLTERETVDRFQGELRDLARSLSPGGLLIGLGGVGGMYREIWTKARAVIESRDVVLVREVGPKLRAHPDQRRRSLILRQLITDLGRIHDLGAALPPDLEGLTYEESFPKFRVTVWRKRSGARRS
jgi:hypothetical protein